MGILKEVNNKLTLFKLKKKNLQGQKCKKCKWRIIKSVFLDTCEVCKVKQGI